jgi:hypothetical protein
MKYAAIIAVSAVSAIMDIYNKKADIKSWADRLFAFVFKVAFGSTIMIALSANISSHILLIVLTSVVTIGGEGIAVWISLNVKEFLSRVLDAATSWVNKKIDNNE